MRSTIVSLLFLSLFTGCPKSAEQPPPAPEPQPETTVAPATTAEPEEGGTPAQCSVDADCVPASCCHATSCVPVAQQQDCSEQMCTKECRGGTLDCGGRCACEAGSCAAKLSSL